LKEVPKKFPERRSNRDVKVRIHEIEACCPHTRVDTRPVGTIGFHFEMGYQEKRIQDRKIYNWSRTLHIQFLRSAPLPQIPISLSHTSVKAKRILLPEEVVFDLERSNTEGSGSFSISMFYSRLFLDPKKTGGTRPIIDLSTPHELLTTHESVVIFSN
jgi:hypothetical protein